MTYQLARSWPPKADPVDVTTGQVWMITEGIYRGHIYMMCYKRDDLGPYGEWVAVRMNSDMYEDSDAFNLMRDPETGRVHYYYWVDTEGEPDYQTWQREHTFRLVGDRAGLGA